MAAETLTLTVTAGDVLRHIPALAAVLEAAVVVVDAPRHARDEAIGDLRVRLGEFQGALDEADR